MLRSSGPLVPLDLLVLLDPLGSLGSFVPWCPLASFDLLGLVGFLDLLASFEFSVSPLSVLTPVHAAGIAVLITRASAGNRPHARASVAATAWIAGDSYASLLFPTLLEASLNSAAPLLCVPLFSHSSANDHRKRLSGVICCASGGAIAVMIFCTTVHTSTSKRAKTLTDTRKAIANQARMHTCDKCECA